MSRLSFKGRFVEPVKSGVKVQTLRKATTLREGDVVPATCKWGEPPFAHLRILGVEEIGVDQISDEVARGDGFDSAEDLVSWLAKHYPGTVKFSKIAFCVVEPAGAV